MINRIFQKILLKTGKTYSIDESIPNKLLLSVLINRLLMLVRGLLILRKKVFLGGSCKILNKKNFFFGNNVTIEKHTILDGYAKNPIIIGNGVKIGAFSRLTTTSHLSKYGIGFKMGNNSAIGDFAHFGASGGIEIGNDVIMGAYISFHSENHNFRDTSKLIREQGVI